MKLMNKRFKKLVEFMVNNTDWRVADCLTQSDIEFLKSYLEKNK